MITAEMCDDLAAGLEHAARTLWRMVIDNDMPWPREKCLTMVERLARGALEMREEAMRIVNIGGSDDVCGGGLVRHNTGKVAPEPNP